MELKTTFQSCYQINVIIKQITKLPNMYNKAVGLKRAIVLFLSKFSMHFFYCVKKNPLTFPKPSAGKVEKRTKSQNKINKLFLTFQMRGGTCEYFFP